MLTYKDFLINQAVCELRYPKGHRYWDKTGETICKIEDELSEWNWEKLDGGKTFLRNKKLKMEAFFSWDRLWVKQSCIDNLNQLKINCDLFSKIIFSNFNIKELSRIGFRIWHVLPCQSVEESEKIIGKGRIFDAELGKQKIFGDKIVAKDYTLIIEDEDNFKFRIAVASVDRKPDQILDKDKDFLKYNPLIGVLVDIDTFKVASIKTEGFSASDFIQKSSKRLENNLLKLFQ